MSAQSIQVTAHVEDVTEQHKQPSHLLQYGWIYGFFALLTALALYVLLAIPQGEI